MGSSATADLTGPGTGTRAWTPVARHHARLGRVECDHPGSMQHFSTLLQVGEQALKLHAVTVLALVEARHPEYAVRRYAELCRAHGSGAWTLALGAAARRLQPLDPFWSRRNAEDWVRDLRDWLTQKRSRADRGSLGEIYAPLADLHADLLAHGLRFRRVQSPTPITVFEKLAEIRNKTTAHRAYGPEFYAEAVAAINPSIAWICSKSPLWEADLALPLRSVSTTRVRILRGVDPVESIELLDAFSNTGGSLTMGNRHLVPLPPLIHIDPGDASTYLANGAWHDSDRSAEFLSYAVEAARADQGSKRLPLLEYAVTGAEPGASETAGEARLDDRAGVVLNNLPVKSDQYVSRQVPERDLRTVLLDPARKHLVVVHGLGGIGKTSLILHLCHELVGDGRSCPYDVILWLSARDIDLTVRGVREVRRESSTLNEVFERFCQAHGEDVPQDDRQAFFETAIREDKYLIVLDNFETFEGQESAYDYFDRVVYPPSKLILTSRHDFRFQYKTVLQGMEFEEARQLLKNTAREVNVEPLMTDDIVEKIHGRCQGHPYAMKLVAAQSRTQTGIVTDLPRVLRQEELLDALFRRSFDDIEDDDEAVFVFLAISRFRRGLSDPALRVLAALAHITNLDAAVAELHSRSLVELEEGEEWTRFDMPAMAREFAQSKLIVGHLLNNPVREVTTFLQRYPDLVAGNVTRAAMGLARDLEDDRTHTALETLGTVEPRVWPLVASELRRAGASNDRVERAYKRAVEEYPTDAALMFEYSEAAASSDLQLELKVQSVGLDPRNTKLASRVALFIRELHASNPGRYPAVRWQALMKPVTDTLEDNLSELTNDERVLLAWLYLRTDRRAAARRLLALEAEFEPRQVERYLSRISEPPGA